MLSIVKVEQSHIEEAYKNGREYMKAMSYEDGTNLTSAYINAGPSIAVLEKNGSLVGLGGIILTNFGVGCAWACLTPKITKYPVGMTRISKTFIEKSATDYQLHRVDVLVDVNFPKAFEWAKALGFEEEGLLRKVGPNKNDSFIMAYLPE